MATEQYDPPVAINFFSPTVSSFGLLFPITVLQIFYLSFIYNSHICVFAYDGAVSKIFIVPTHHLLVPMTIN